ncbi:zinc finger, GRF-type containing protein, partial [Tanacetum coccineum]
MDHPFCVCGRRAMILTSWTNINPGRRFYACPRRDSPCIFFHWVDPPICEGAVAIIPGLLRSRNQIEAYVRQLEA